MLTELVVEGLGVIDHAELHLSTGSSALTGETGAGKTLLVAALGLLLGARADKTLVRQGSAAAVVEARFEVHANHPSLALLSEQGLAEPAGMTEIILSRTVTSDGRSKARANGRLITLALLQNIGHSLVEISGQNEHHELGHPSIQRVLLDAFGGSEVSALAAQVSEAVDELAHLTTELGHLSESERDRTRELDILRFEIKEIEDVSPRPDETEELSVSAGRLEHADLIATAMGAAIDKLKGEGGVGELLAGAHRELDSIVDKDPSAAPLADRLRAVAVEVTDITEELARDPIQTDPSALAATRDRISFIARLFKKYGSSEVEVIEYLEKAKGRAGALESSELDTERMARLIAAAEQRALDLARELSLRRQRVATELEKRVQEMLADLALGDARFKVELSPRDLYRGGIESVGFLIAANAGEAPKPLAKVASGGELSRIALALRLLTSPGTANTLVFDEVDAGVGGAAARSVGRCLAELGAIEGMQVLVVTHLPQVAAFADHQYRVSKMTANDRTTSLVEPVEDDDRIEELSRMLAGLPDSMRARDHAQELLELAGRKGDR